MDFVGACDSHDFVKYVITIPFTFITLTNRNFVHFLKYQHAFNDSESVSETDRGEAA